MLTQLETNLVRVRTRLEDACARAGRDPETVRLLPVTKYVNQEIIHGLLELGFTEFAENRAQLLRQRAEEFPATPPDWVMIGHLQRNKAGQVARIVNEVQSVDSVRLAEALSRQAGLLDKTLNIYVQVNTSAETAKSGFSPEELGQAIQEISNLPGLDLRGLMTMAALGSTPEEARTSFRRLRELRDTFAPGLPGLSMGMSGDFEAAIEEGATVVRVGSSLYEGLL